MALDSMRATLVFFIAVMAVPRLTDAQAKTIEIHYTDDGEISHTTVVDGPEQLERTPGRTKRKARDVSVREVARLVNKLAGRATLMVLWATDCPACRAFMPRVSKLARRWGPEGLSVVTFSLDESGSRFRRYARKLGGGLELLRIRRGEKGQLKKQLRELGVKLEGDSTPIPLHVFFDKEGKPVRAQTGGSSYSYLEKMTGHLLGSRGQTPPPDQ